MSILALSLIIISAFMHASWNYLAKKSDGGFTFVWLYMLLAAIFYFPVFIYVLISSDVKFGMVAFIFVAGSSIIHLVYSLALQKGYSIGDFSLIYPIARGSGPPIVALVAYFLYAEHLSIVEIIGIILITCSIFIMTGGLQAMKSKVILIPVIYGLFIGTTIASYTLLDKGAVSIAQINPFILVYGVLLGKITLLTPYALKHWHQVKRNWRNHKDKAIGVGVLELLAYFLVLYAMTFTNVSSVASVREISILIGTILGTKLLKEGFGYRRTIAACTMVLGVVFITVSS